MLTVKASDYWFQIALISCLLLCVYALITNVCHSQGDILDIERQGKKTVVLVNEGLGTVSYALDDQLIEFGTAIDDGDFLRCAAYMFLI